MEKQATEYAASYVKSSLAGSPSKSICKAILAGPKPTIMAAMVAVMIMREDQDSDMAEEFIRLLSE